MENEENEVLETTNETENVDTQSTEENEDLELTDSTESEIDANEDEEQEETEEQEQNIEDKENKQVNPKKRLKDILEENPELQEEFNQKMKDRLSRQKDKLTREYSNKYSRLEDLLVAGVGGKDVEENTRLLEEMYKEQGINLPDNKPKYSQREVEILANAEADSIIKAGYEEIVDETERMLKIGYENMTTRDKIIFKKIADARKAEENKKELRSLGIDENFLEDKEFKAFEKEYDIPKDMPFSKKYKLFQKTIKKNDNSDQGRPGSMKNNDSKVEKDIFTPEEVDLLKPEDYDNPKILAKIRKSMLSW